MLSDRFAAARLISMCGPVASRSAQICLIESDGSAAAGGYTVPR